MRPQWNQWVDLEITGCNIVLWSPSEKYFNLETIKTWLILHLADADQSKTKRNEYIWLIIMVYKKQGLSNVINYKPCEICLGCEISFLRIKVNNLFEISLICYWLHIISYFLICSQFFFCTRELLKGPLYYVATISLATIIYWRTSPISIAAICNLCAGDGNVATRCSFQNIKLEKKEKTSSLHHYQEQRNLILLLLTRSVSDFYS